MNTLEDSTKEFENAIKLERVISRKLMAFLRVTFFVATLVCIVLSLFGSLFTESTLLSQTTLGLTLIFFAFWLEQILLFSYHNSYYFKGLNSLIGLADVSIQTATYDAAKVVLTKPDDVTFAFCTSQWGGVVLLRAGVPSSAIASFLTSPRTKISTTMIPLPTDEVFSLITLGTYLSVHDAGFKALLREQGVQEKTFLGSLRWVIGSYHREKQTMRWWSKDTLSRTTGIGREWSHGTAYLLESFSRSINTTAVFSTLTLNSPFAAQKVNEIESSLARVKSANVLIVGEPGVGKIDLVMEVKRRMSTGKSLDSISGQEIIVLDTNRLFASHQTKQEFEITLLTIFDEALRAGNIIIVIENLSTFIKEGEALGVFIPELLDEYLATPLLHVIATDTPGGFHTVLQPLHGFVSRFNEVLIEAPDLSATIGVLQGIAQQQEVRFGTVFTYASLEAIATAADRHIVEGTMPDKAITLLIDVATQAQQSQTEIITSDFVYTIVSAKTGIPSGPIQDDERELLLHLEDTLHARVIGQGRALGAIARTMRRARTGIQSSDKPIGSFLFLGPTGVGKTETAKALAYTFFGGEEKMQRFDMSEYSGTDALERLIGDGINTGTLPDALHEHPYCVILLDELEKAAKSVHDVFLQILDEGIFTDARGDKVNARNTIIVATSNAGSRLIINTVQQRKELSHLTQEIINSIISDGVFRPELLNRFDSTIIFEPLTIEEQGQIASLMLGGLYERVREQGYEITIGRDLMDLLVSKGYSPEFGARPMQRVLQDLVEEKIAQKIIAGVVKKGDTIHLTKEDFTEIELSA